MPDTTPLAVGDYPGIHIEYDEKPYRRYVLNGDEVPSVTTALGIINKPALMFYAERETADGMRRLASRASYSFPRNVAVPEGARALLLPADINASPERGEWLDRWGDVDKASKTYPSRLIRLGKGWDVLTGTRISIQHMKMLKVDHASKTGEAADRGVDVHAVWEAWNTRREIPNASDYPENRRGYIWSMAKFIMAHQPKAMEAEIVVGSAVHGFAGRLDTVVVIHGDSGLAMLDVKTGKGVYPSTHFPQLAAYELARRECGLTPTERQGILRLDGQGGDPELAWSDATAEDFLAVLGAWRSQAKWTRKGRR